MAQFTPIETTYDRAIVNGEGYRVSPTTMIFDTPQQDADDRI